jgi:hypothetical protein
MMSSKIDASPVKFTFLAFSGPDLITYSLPIFSMSLASFCVTA